MCLKLVGLLGDFLRLYLFCWKGSAPFVHCVLLDDFTLGSCTGTGSGDDGVGNSGNVGSSSTLCKASAIFKIAFLVASPASNVTVVVADGLVKIDIISKAACFKKSSVLTAGNGTTFGKKVTVSTSL